MKTTLIAAESNATEEQSSARNVKLLKARDACALCGTSLRTWRSWDAAGKIPRPVRIGRMVFWRRDELLAWIAAGCPRRNEWPTTSSAGRA